MESTASRREVFFHALAFVIGFSLVFVALGASVAFVGYALNQYLSPVVKAGGIVVIIFGLQVAGVFSRIADRVRRSGARQFAAGAPLPGLRGWPGHSYVY